MSKNMIFCLGEGIGYQKNNMCFNRPVKNFKKWKELIEEILENFRQATFVKEENMTENEKEENPRYKVLKGFLKILSYKEAWEVFWGKIDDKTKKKFKELPNFDKEIFQKITGIKYNF